MREHARNAPVTRRDLAAVVELGLSRNDAPELPALVLRVVAEHPGRLAGDRIGNRGDVRRRRNGCGIGIEDDRGRRAIPERSHVELYLAGDRTRHRCRVSIRDEAGLVNNGNQHLGQLPDRGSSSMLAAIVAYVAAARQVTVGRRFLRFAPGSMTRRHSYDIYTDTA